MLDLVNKLIKQHNMQVGSAVAQQIADAMAQFPDMLFTANPRAINNNGYARAAFHGTTGFRHGKCVDIVVYTNDHNKPAKLVITTNNGRTGK